jgi:hypothetical protein
VVERYVPESPKHFVGGVLQKWTDALDDIVGPRADKRALIKLLKKNTPMPWPAPWYLAELLELYNLTKRASRGGKTVLSYDDPPALRKLNRAKRYYERRVASGMSKDQAIREAATKAEVDTETFRNFLIGKNAHARRVQKRKPPTNPRP